MAISKINSKALVDCSVAAVDIEDGSITSAKLAGSIANAKLANSSITVNGNTVSLGASGSIPPVQWQSVVTADGSTTTTAVSGNGYFIDTTSAAHTITLPASPSAGDYVAIKDYAGTFGTNALTIGRNSENIQGVANDSQISTNRASVVLVYIDSTKGWLYTVESNVADLQLATYISATGGTITTSGDYKIHTFTGDGCFVVSCTGNPVGSDTVDYLVVAGGGSGGKGNGGAGGAGGYRESSGAASGCYTISPLGACVSALSVSTTTYPVTVGGGGAAQTSPYTSGNQGSSSTFSSITSTGGGFGGSYQNDGGTGGSGGGGGGGNPAIGGPTTGGSGNTPPVSPPQGQNGGNSAAPNNGTGGGGGAGGAGSSPSPDTTGGPGGNGLANSITGCSVTYAGGGGGWGRPGPGGSGGSGGGGAGAVEPAGTTAGSGTANTGGGGGGSGNPSPPGGAGGKGIVIIRYKYQ